MEPSSVVSAARLLVSPESGTHGYTHLLEKLRSNLRSFYDLLSSPERAPLRLTLSDLRRPLAGRRRDSTCSRDVDCCWEFVVEGLCLLELLNASLKCADTKMPVSTQGDPSRSGCGDVSPTPPSAEPTSPSPLLSVADQSVVHSLLQFVVSLGVFPYLLPGANTLMALRLARTRASIPKADFLFNAHRAWRLHKVCLALSNCSENTAFGAAVLTNHFPDILVALCQVCFAPDKPEWGGPRLTLSGEPERGGGHVTFSGKPEREGPRLAPSDNPKQGERHAGTWERVPTTPASVVSNQPDNEELSSDSDPKISVAERESCFEILRKLLSRVYQPLVVRELLALQRAAGLEASPHLEPQPSSEAARPKLPVGRVRGDSGGRAKGKERQWLLKACGQLLSERLMQQNGVVFVLQGIFEGMGDDIVSGGGLGGDPSNWKKVQSVAGILARCPARAGSVEEYYALVCPQLIRVLHSSSDMMFKRIAVTAMRMMLKDQRTLAMNYLINPLLHPLRQLSQVESVFDLDKLNKSLPLCLTAVHDICCIVEPSSPLTTELVPFLPTLFRVWMAGKESDCLVSAQARVVVAALLRELDSTVTVAFFMVLQKPVKKADHHFVLLSPEISLSVSEPSKLTIQRVGPEDQLIHSIDHMETVTACTLDLLKTELKSSFIPAHLFLSALEHLARVLCTTVGLLAPSTSKSATQDDTDAPNVSGVAREATMPLQRSDPTSAGAVTSSALLECERRGSMTNLSEGYGDTSVLYLAAALCELMSADILEKINLPALFEVLSRVIDCHASLCPSQEGVAKEGVVGLPLILQPSQSDCCELLGGPVTLSMALGLLSAVLGGARQISRDDRPLLSAMLPSLSTTASSYPDAELAGLANDLRICIATLGAVWSAEMREKAAGGGKVCGGLADAAKRSFPQEEGKKKGKGRGLKSQPRRSRAERKGCNAMANKSGTEGSATPPDQSATPPTPAELTSASDLAKGSPSPPEHARRHRSYTPSKAAMRLPSGPSQPSSVKEAVVLANQARPGRSNRVGTEVHLSGFPEQPPTPSPFQRAMLELADSLLPVRGHALLALAKLLRERDTETVAHATTLLAIFKENLGHSDSYIYLAAVDGLSALAVAVPGAASLLALCRDYAGLAGRPSREQSRDYDSETGRIRRRGDASVTDAPGRWLSSEERVKVGEALVRVVRGSGEVLPCHADEVLAAILFNVRDPDAVIRASALSNLADVCPSLGYSFGLVQHEVLSCIRAILLTDKDARVRQAALVVLKMLIERHSQNSMQVLGGEVLREVYHLLKGVESTEEDALTRSHAQAALGALDTTMRQFLFPEQALSKKISVLDLSN